MVFSSATARTDIRQKNSIELCTIPPLRDGELSPGTWSARCQCTCVSIRPSPRTSTWLRYCRKIRLDASVGWRSTRPRLESGATRKLVGMMKETEIASESGSVFLNGMLNLVTDDPVVVAVDMEGKTWRTIPIRSLQSMVAENFAFGSDGFISQTQGHLCYVSYTRKRDPSNLSVWILEDYCRGEWIFKYNISPCSSQLSRKKDFIFQDYNVIAVHPECSLIFLFLKSENVLVSYDKDRGEVCVIHNLEYDFCGPYLPYVPLFSESLADQN
ncbi:hypothetical protein ACQ4PT_009494 [Festuca glaucescens]